MVQADAGTRFRLIVILTVIGTLFGGLILNGLLQRVGVNAPGSDDAVSAMTMAKAREEAAKNRAIRDQLAALGKQGKWDAAAALSAEKLKDNDRPFLHFLHAEALIRAGRYDEAIPEMDKSLRDGDPVAEAERLAFLGDRDGYRRFCEKALSAAENDARWANNTAWMCVALKDGLPDYRRPLALSEKAVAATNPPDEKWIYINTLGAVLYRAGRFQEAKDRLMEAEKIHPDPFNWPFLALAEIQLGNPTKAQYWLTRLKGKLDQTYATPTLSQSRHELLLFMHEADGMMPPATP